MSNFSISGKVTAVTPTKEGTGDKQWKSCRITVKELVEDFPNEIQLDYAKFGDNVKYYKVPNIGDVVDVEFTAKQTTYKERVFNSLSIWKLEVKQEATAVASDDLPF